jgi:hypothetical protein
VTKVWFGCMTPLSVSSAVSIEAVIMPRKVAA